VTEGDWLACSDPQLMQRFLRRTGAGSERKFRRFACACCRRIWDQFPDPRNRDLVVAVEDYPEHTSGDREIYDPGVASSAREHEFGLNPAHWVAKYLGRGFYKMSAADSAVEVVMRVQSVADAGGGRDVEAQTQAGLVREVFGNPFRSVLFSSDWRTETAVLLARQMYNSRDFSAMPILADALQDAGCESEELLNHLRGPGPHARGCWAVDLVLGKG
jgi:hypothetical protein